MKKYTLKLKGTKKNQTEDLTIEIFGQNKSQAYSWAYSFFEKGEFTNPYYAKGTGQWSGTEKFIPNASQMMDLAGKYFVPRTAVK
ncbi:MAG: hypothetical protein ACI7YS_17405 [Flavobacterium sp.]